jgi:hypothetical protein
MKGNAQMDMQNLTSSDIWTYTRVYMWGTDTPKNSYPASWELWNEDDNHVDEYCWVDHTGEYTPSHSTSHWACCRCGCGQTANVWYLPGHDQKHYGALLREWSVAVNNRDRGRIIRNAQKHTTDGVWAKFMTRTGFNLVRDDEGRTFFMMDLYQAVVKVGRWYYPVVIGTDGKAYRSTTSIKKTFDAGHSFEIEVAINDVEFLTDIRHAQEKEREAA